MKSQNKINWLKSAALIVVAVLVPTLTLAEEAVVASAVAPTSAVVGNIGDFKLPAKQVDVTQAIPLGPVPADRVGGDNKIVTPTPAEVGSGETEEVEVTAPSEAEEGYPIIAAIPMAIAINAILGAIIFGALPF